MKSIPLSSVKIRLYLTNQAIYLTFMMNSMENANKNVCRLLLRSPDLVEKNDLEVNNYSLK